MALVLFTGSKVLVCNINQTPSVLLQPRTRQGLLEPIVPGLGTGIAASLVEWLSSRYPSS